MTHISNITDIKTIHWIPTFQGFTPHQNTHHQQTQLHTYPKNNEKMRKTPKTTKHKNDGKQRTTETNNREGNITML